MKKIFISILLINILIPFGGITAYQEKWTDSNYQSQAGGTESDQKTNAEFKLTGNIFSSYEFNDHGEDGSPDSTGPTKQKQGFAIDRAYLNFMGTITSGEFQGWDFRVTTDAFQAADLGDGCVVNCEEGNDYVVILKYAYLTIPLFEKTFLRLGQQHTPLVDGKGGISLQKYWGHRHVAKQTIEETALTSSTDRGIGLIHKSDYMGLHLLFANGEGYHKNSAQNLSSSSDLKTLAYGSGDSYGYDLYGMVSLIPTGKSKKISFSVNFPFRLHNIVGIDRSETRYVSADVTDITAPTVTIYEGDTRAKRDLTGGVEADLSLKLGGVSFTVGGGSIINVDRRSNSYRHDLDGINYYDPADVTANSYFASDARGTVNYIFTHLRIGRVGAFARYTTGVTTDKLDGKLHLSDGRDWMTQAVIYDAGDGQFGNVTANDLAANIDQGHGRFKSVIYGIDYHLTPAFTITIGMSELSGRDGSGREFRENSLEKIGKEGAATTNLAEQLENNDQFKNSLGYQSGEKLVINDYIGKPVRNRQIFIRTNFVF